jgi:hypothetical protein
VVVGVWVFAVAVVIVTVAVGVGDVVGFVTAVVGVPVVVWF